MQGARAKILVVEDDASLNDIVRTFLEKKGYSCLSAFSGSEASMILESIDGSSGIDLVVTDLMLPGLSGESLVSLIREKLGDVPVVVISARSEVGDRVSLLRSGADDYLVKPFDLNELLARIEVQLRRKGSVSFALNLRESEVLSFGLWELSAENRRFSVSGEEVKLTRTEFCIVEELMRNPRRAFSKGDLYRAACSSDLKLADVAVGAVTSADEKTVSTHVGNLRAKLKGTGTEDYIETVWGIGFKLKELS